VARWLVPAAVVVALVAGTAAVWWLGFRPHPAQAKAEHRVLVHGDVTNMIDKKGIDLDTGVIDVDNATGQDVSPFGRASSLGAMELPVHFSLLPQPGPVEYARCGNLSLTSWTRDVKVLYRVPPGQNICVQTDQGRLAMMTLDHPPTYDVGMLSFRYVTWAN
jgi:hypothetical protein